MSAWASADAAALKKGEASDDHFGLLLLAYPVSDELKDEWAQARAKLERDPRLSGCLLYTSPSPRDATLSRMPSSA